MLTRGTQNKMQDMNTAVPAERLQRHASTGFGVDARGAGRRRPGARGRSTTSPSVTPAGVTLIKKPRTTRRHARRRRGWVDESAAIAAQQPQPSTPRRLGLYAQDLMQVAPDWKLLGGLRWDRFKGDYRSFADRPPAANVRGGHGHRRPQRTRLAVEQALRRAVPADADDDLPLLVRHLVQHLGRHLPVRPPGSQHAARSRAATSSSARKLDLPTAG